MIQTLPPKLDPLTASELRSQLLDRLAAPGPIVLDGSAVEATHTACLQVLCAFAREAAAAGRPLSWSGASPVLRETARRLGLAGALALA